MNLQQCALCLRNLLMKYADTSVLFPHISKYVTEQYFKLWHHYYHILSNPLFISIQLLNIR
jgi:hypothetical protein